MKKITIFLGPTLSIDEAKTYLSCAQYKTPAKRGDISREIKLNTEIIGLIDGMFLEYSAVGHREILNAINSGIKIYGAASMGALRAFEMKKYGMIGIGKVYELYNGGILDSDDEVAVIYDQYNLTQITEALVDIRETLSNAKNKNIITSHEYNKIINSIKKIHYSQRTYEYIFDILTQQNILSTKRLYKLNLWIQSGNSINVKKNDCISLLKYINKKYINNSNYDMK